MNPSNWQGQWKRFASFLICCARGAVVEAIFAFAKSTEVRELALLDLASCRFLSRLALRVALTTLKRVPSSGPPLGLVLLLERPKLWCRVRT